MSRMEATIIYSLFGGVALTLILPAVRGILR
jgi:hypothetical protein